MVGGDSEVLGWVVRRITGKGLGELLSERVLSQLGAQETPNTGSTASAPMRQRRTQRDRAAFAAIASDLRRP